MTCSSGAAGSSIHWMALLSSNHDATSGVLECSTRFRGLWALGSRIFIKILSTLVLTALVGIHSFAQYTISDISVRYHSLCRANDRRARETESYYDPYHGRLFQPPPLTTTTAPLSPYNLLYHVFALAACISQVPHPNPCLSIRGQLAPVHKRMACRYPQEVYLCCVSHQFHT